MNTAQLDFEHGTLDLERQVDALGALRLAESIDLGDEICSMRAKFETALDKVYRGLDAWQIVKVARHPDRPHTLDFIGALFTDFIELHGDRAGADDPAIVGGLACFGDRPVVVIGHQKGRNLKERTRRNFGMPRPEGYRKAMRLMEMAERFGLPLVTLIDTPGAFPGIEAEERGQSAAIGESIYRMSQLRVPTVSIVIGEGGSGGALAIGVADVVCMLEYATYSVISPEGCASILWKSASQAEAAANALGLTAGRLKALGLIDEVIAEPIGGAHRCPSAAATIVGTALSRILAALDDMAPSKRLALRKVRLRAAGAYDEATSTDPAPAAS